MNPKLPKHGFLTALAAVVCIAQAASAFANRGGTGFADAPQDFPAISPAAPTAPLTVAPQSPQVNAQADTSARRNAARSPAASPAREQSANPTGGRGGKPVDTATTSGPERPGYVHYFLLTLPDESLETLVGIEMPGRRIAWSFPDLGVVVAPLAEKGVVTAGGREYGVSHLYGIRPFPDDAAMNELRGELAGRVGRWVAAGTPYCEADGPRSNCMSCLGFVLRVLFPGRRSDYPDLPGDFWRAMYEKSYSTEDLLLYLTGMLDLPNREARLKRAGKLDLPDALRADVQELVDAMDASGATPPPTGAGAPQPAAAQKSPAARPAKISTRPAQRKRL